MSRITSSPVGSILDSTIKPESRLLKGNVFLARAVFVTASVGGNLLALSNDLNGRDTIDPGNIAEVQRRLANALASLNEVAAEANAADSGYLLDGCTWEGRNALSAARAAAKGVA